MITKSAIDFREGRKSIASITPLRISYLGGGSDYKDFFSRHEGAVLGCTFDWFINTTIMSLPPVAEEKFRITYRKTESVQKVEDIEHPAVRECLRLNNFETPLNIATMSSVQGRTGLGSSSSFVVGLAKSLRNLNNQSDDANSVARDAIEVERFILKEAGGWQDQYHAAWGGFREYRFSAEKVINRKIIEDAKTLRSISDCHLLVWIGNESHSSTNSIKTNTSINDLKLFETVKRNATIAREASDKLSGASRITVDSFLKILEPAIQENWILKREFSGIETTSRMYDVIEEAKKFGIVTFKVLGAGNRGFILLLGDPDKIEKIKKSESIGYTYSPRLIDSGSKIMEIS